MAFQVLECKLKAKKAQYKIHYKGWNKRWDEWVDHGRLLKINASNLQIMQEKKNQNREKQHAQQPPGGDTTSSLQSPSSDSGGKKRKSRGSGSSKHGSSSSNSSKRRRLNEDEQKQRDSASGDTLSAPLEIKLPTPLKKKLIGDWESITKRNLVMTLPRTSGSRVCDILDDFERFAVQNGQQKDIVAEVARGIKDYFNQALQVTLLYKLERNQLHGLSAQHGDLSMDQMYGVEHLCRLFVKLPQLLSPNDLDVDTRRILKMQIEFMVDFVLQKEEYWNTHYVQPTR